MPNLQVNRSVVLEEFLYKLYLEYQTEVIGGIVWLAFLASTYAGYLYQV